MAIKLDKQNGVKTIEEDFGSPMYLIMPDVIMKRTDITNTQKLVLGLIFSFIFNGQPFVARNPYIARRLGMKGDLVKDAIKELEKKKYIERIVIHKTIRKQIILGKKLSTILQLGNKLPSTREQVTQSLGNRLPNNNNKSNSKYIRHSLKKNVDNSTRVVPGTKETMHMLKESGRI